MPEKFRKAKKSESGELKTLYDAVHRDYDEVSKKMGVQSVPLELYWKEPWLRDVSGHAKVKGKQHVAISITPSLPWYEQEGRQKLRVASVHELLHVKGMKHGEESRKIGYISSIPKDSFSRKLMKDLGL